ncbi:TraM recognition domain-containing protein, partial [Lactobacillus salivarius]|nr:TraM recognition domain-containing protein [Ligilactobacillus salivarius]
EKLNIGLGQNIQFMLFVQELTQLVDKYGKESADGILAACSLNILIKAIVKDTLSFYSEQLGKKTITKRGKSTNILDEANPNIRTENPEQALMTVTQLRNLQAGEMVIIRGVKTMDRYGKKVTPDPIFAHG